MENQLNSKCISWAQFESRHSDIQMAFENMCRLLFNNSFFGGNAFLHSNPNNPGIEVLPIFHSVSGKRISFQAKYFTKADYPQIKDSAEKVVKYYAGDLDVVYLYCNRDLATTSKAYKAIEALLKSANIDLVPICNQTILDQVLANSIVAWSYFDHQILTHEWFCEMLAVSTESLGPRYNRDFNVETTAEDLFNTFLHNANAVKRINEAKNKVYLDIKRKSLTYKSYIHIWQPIVNALAEISDVNPLTIEDSLLWEDTIRAQCVEQFQELENVLKEKEEAYWQAVEGRNKDADNLYQEILDLQRLIECPGEISPSVLDKRLIVNKALVVRGTAGSGKSQLFATMAEHTLAAGGTALLTLGSQYLTNDPLSIQFPQGLGLDCNLEALLQKLEAIGINTGSYTYLFIDAINESPCKNIWKTGLSQLFTAIEKYNHIRVAISVRDGYESQVFSDAIQNKLNDGAVSEIVHAGFTSNSIEATFAFLKYYHIPFAPAYYFDAEMANPLFLTLFCKYYSDPNNYDLFSLFNQLIIRADKEAQEGCGLDGSTKILPELIKEIANVRLEEGYGNLSPTKLFGLPFWDTYGLSNQKLFYINLLKKADFLITIPAGDSEWYCLSYHLLEDYLCAKVIIEKYSSKGILLTYLKENLLKIENGSLLNYSNIDIFIIVCSLYAEKADCECFSEIISFVNDNYGRFELVRRYIESFAWRKANTIDAESFVDLLNQYHIDTNTAFELLIKTSCREGHPLNAELLHHILIKKSLVDRDYMWTTYINGLAADESQLCQIITYFENGNSLDGLSTGNIELLLTLLSWLLTSSNRFLRDKASKASIELLRREFSLCIPLLRKFETVNDPYVLQRLYGIIFGACVKRNDNNNVQFRALAEYVYKSIFDQEYVYPDALLRDYALLILERWIYENPDDCDFIDAAKIAPPYYSPAIPKVNPEDYYIENASKSGFNLIVRSMYINSPDIPGIYGDFGRYVFQAVLEKFEDIDIVNLYHYAMQFIRDELGYSDDLLGKYDAASRGYSYNRHDTKKIERIGKKYQWIALHHIFARVSDTHLVENWDWNTKSLVYKGAWNPYIRDFDPTLNVTIRPNESLPTFQEHIIDREELLPLIPFPTDSIVQIWINTKPELFISLSKKLLLQDEDGQEWVVLNLYSEVQDMCRDDYDFGYGRGTQSIWAWAHGCLASKADFNLLLRHHRANAGDTDIALGGDIYQLFNREYVWSSGSKSFFDSAWMDYELAIGSMRTKKEEIEMPDMQEDENGNIAFEITKKIVERQVPSDVKHLQIMRAYLRVLWEEEYDASQQEATAFYVPCADIIDKLKLEQKQFDGLYCAPDGELVAYDREMYGDCRGLLIKKDYLQRYLEQTGLKLFWVCNGEKQFFLGNNSQKWTDWRGVLHFDDGKIVGEVELADRDGTQ